MNIQPTSIQGTPQLLTATTRCGTCGTSDVISGRPGSKLREFRCRSCKTLNKVCVPGGDTFTFQGHN